MALFSKSRLVAACFVLHIIVLYLTTCTAASKYSEKVNSKYNDKEDSAKKLSQLENEDAPFRMKKVNLLWTKAKKYISGQKLADLYADLKIHDKEEGILKKLRSNNADKDGKKEAKILESYKYIIEFYGLDDFNKENLDNEIPMQGDETKSVHFQNPKLQSMWKRAEKSGFSDEDLQALKEEFWHQQMKLNEFDFLRRELNSDEDPDENIIDTENVKTNLSPEEKKDKMHNLKKHNKDIKEGYMYLEQMASTLPRKELEFKDYRVQKLWALAKKTNWTEREIESFKEELKHFEHRLSKQDYYQEQLELTRDALKTQMKDGDHYPEKLAELKDKTDLVKQKVKKLHNHMKSRLEKALRHTEL